MNERVEVRRMRSYSAHKLLIIVRKLRANFSQRRSWARSCDNLLKNKQKHGKKDGYKRQEYKTSGGRDHDLSSGNDPQQFRTSTTWTITQNRLSLYDKYE